MMKRGTSLMEDMDYSECPDWYAEIIKEAIAIQGGFA